MFSCIVIQGLGQSHAFESLLLGLCVYGVWIIISPNENENSKQKKNRCVKQLLEEKEMENKN